MSNRFEIVMPGLGASSNRGAIGLCNISLIYTGSKTILVDTGSKPVADIIVPGHGRSFSVTDGKLNISERKSR